MEQNVVLEMRDISKNFTGVRALSHGRMVQVNQH